MFKLLLPVLFFATCMIIIISAYPHPEEEGVDLMQNYDGYEHNIQTRAAQSPPQSSSDAQSEDNSNEAESTNEESNDEDAEDSQQPSSAASQQLQLSPAGVTRLAPIGSISSRSSYVINSPARASIPAIQHHFLPAQAIPLPITISTRPGIRTVIAPETITIQEPTIAKVGEVVQKIPTAVSHQSQTIVHKHAHIVTPIVAPALRTITSQVVRAYHTPIVYAPQLPAQVRVVSY